MRHSSDRSGRLRSIRIAAIATSALLLGGAASPPARRDLGAPLDLGLGQTATPQELSKFFETQPDGAGLPDGHGSTTDGAKLFAEKCAMCHGDKLQGIKSLGAPALAGGRGTLKDVPPKKTVESYWPYSTTLFNYIKSAMPFTAPGTLTNDEVYALSAYILAQDHIVADGTVLDKASLPKVEMPNAKGFVPFPGPSRQFFR